MLLPSSVEKYLDDFIEGQGESMLKGAFVLVGMKIMSAPVASILVSLFHLDPSTVSAWAQMGAAAIALWFVHFIHHHFFNGNIEVPTVTLESGNDQKVTSIPNPQTPPVAAPVASQTQPQVSSATPSEQPQK